jgi:hypothetical protein
MVTNFLTLLPILAGTEGVQPAVSVYKKTSAIVQARNLSPPVAVLCPIA